MASFRVGKFEELHATSVARLAASGDGAKAAVVGSPDLEAAFAELEKEKQAFAVPFVFAPPDPLDLQSLAKRVMALRTRLATEPLIRAVDEVSRSLRLRQDDCCEVVEHVLDLTTDVSEVPRLCAAVFYRECHFQALCLHDLAQNLVPSGPGQQPDAYSVAFFALLGGKAFVKALFEALELLLRDLTGERANDQAFLSHAGSMIQLLVGTLLAYFFTFEASAEEAEKVICFLPHVVQAAHAPLSTGFTVSDLDLILREEHSDISIKLCLALICICHPQLGEGGKLDISRVPAGVPPSVLRITDFVVRDGAAGAAGGGSAALLASSPLGAKMRAGNYWNEESQLGQFLCFAISGVLLEDERALRSGYAHWHVFHFLLNEVLLSSSIVGDSCTSSLVLHCVQELLASALLPVGRRWVAVKKLEAQAVNFRLIAPDSLQISGLRTLNRLCRLYPPACEIFREIALHSADTFHLALPHGATALLEGGAAMVDPWGQQPRGPVPLAGVPGLVPGGGNTLALLPPGAAAAGSLAASFFGAPGAGDVGDAPWIGAPPGTAGTSSAQPQQGPRHDNSALYAEVLDFVATVCARGSLQGARLVAHKLQSHSNQWFNWAFLLDCLAQHVRAPLLEQQQLLFAARGSGVGGGVPLGPATSTAWVGGQLLRQPAPTLAALCRLLSAMCSSRLWLCQPPPHLDTQALQTVFYAGTPSVENFGTLLTELLAACPEPLVQAACFGSMAQLDFSPAAARAAFGCVTDLLPSLLSGLCDVRGSHDGLLAIELLACALRLVHAVPLDKGRYSLNLQPLTHVVVHFIYMKVLANKDQFAAMARYWRLAALALRWLRVALRGPLPAPLGASGAVAPNAGAGIGGGLVPGVQRALVEPYASDGDHTALREVAEQVAAGNATAYVFRCLLALDSPIFKHVIHLTVLRGRGVDGLAEGHRSGVLRPLLEQAARVGLDILRILFQRDVLFVHLHAQQAAQRVHGRSAELDDSSLMLTHRLLFQEFAHTYPPEQLDGSTAAANQYPFASRRLWHRAAAPPSAGVGGRRLNPSNLSLLLEFVGASPPRVSSLALFVFAQCAIREPATVLQTLQLEPWRLQRLSADLRQQILQPEEESSIAATTHTYQEWDEAAELRFLFEAAEMDTPLDSFAHLDVSSFRTSLPVCSAVDAAQHLADDALVQSADLAAWARGAGLKATSSDTGYFAAGYLRGFEVPDDWLAKRRSSKGSRGSIAPPQALATTSFRHLALRTFALLLGEESLGSSAAELAQVVLGLDPRSATLGGPVDIDAGRATDALPLDAIMVLLQNPPPIPTFAEPTPSASSTGTMTLAVSNRGGSPLKQAKVDPSLGPIVKEHAAYEAALGIIVALLAVPVLRDVAFRYLVTAWPSRHQILVDLLSQPWPALPPPMRRVLLSQASLLMQTAAWEMRLVPPLGSPPPPAPEDLSIAGRQRLELRHSDAEVLQDVARSIVSTSDAGPAAHGATPFLVETVQKLAAACDSVAEVQLPKPSSALFFKGPIHDALQASVCMCLAPSDDGPLQLCLCMRDPHLLLQVWDRERSMLPTGGYGASPAGSSADLDAQCEEALRHLAACNDAASGERHASAVFRSLGLFLSAVLHHLTGGARPSSIARDPRAQDLRAHLEALFPELAAPMLAKPSFWRLEALLGFAEHICAAMHRLEAPAPLAFAYSLFRLVRDVATHPSITAEARRHAIHTLLLLLQRMLPDAPQGIGEERMARIGEEDLIELSKLAGTLLSSTSSLAGPSCSPGSDRRSTASLDVMLPLLGSLLIRVPASQLQAVVPNPAMWQQLVGLIKDLPRIHEVPAAQLRDIIPSAEMWQQLVGIIKAAAAFDGGAAMEELQRHSSPVMGVAAALRRLPQAQLRAAVPSVELWQQLVGLLEAAAAFDSASEGSMQRQCAAMGAAAALCRTPELATCFYESGGLEVVLSPALLSGCIVRFAPPGLPAIELPHPAVLLGVLEVLSAVIGSLPTHRLAIAQVMFWMEQHSKVLLELLQWMARLPLATSVEPHSEASRPLGPAPWDSELGGALSSAAMVHAVTAMSAGAIPGSVLLVFCAPDMRSSNSDLDLSSTVLSGRFGFTTLGPAVTTEERDRVLALLYRCSVHLVELWASLLLGARKTSAEPLPLFASGQALSDAILRVASQVEPILATMLAQFSSIDQPLWQDVAAETSPPVGLLGNSDLSPRLPYGTSVGAASGAAGGGATTQASAASQQQQRALIERGLYPSESMRLALCVRILHSWRYDPTTEQLRILTERGPTLAFTEPPRPGMPMPVVPGGGFAGGAAVAAAIAAAAAQLAAAARARVNVLCTTFVHACSELLGLRFVRRPGGVASALGTGVAGSGSTVAPTSPHLEFKGSVERFRQLLLVVEMALHLLQTYLATLLLGGLGVVLAPGVAPRPALVVQQLRVLRQFAAATGNSVALAPSALVMPESGAPAGAFAGDIDADTCVVVELAYVAIMAARVEQQLFELQSL